MLDTGYTKEAIEEKGKQDRKNFAYSTAISFGVFLGMLLIGGLISLVL